GDRVNGGRAPYGLGLGFGQSEMADFSLAHEIGQGADGVLDRRLRIDPMLVIEVDRLDSEPLEARVARLAHVSGVAPDRKESALRTADGAEFRGQYDLVAAAPDCPPDQLFVASDPVHVGRIEKRKAALDRAMDGGDRLVVVATGVEFRHPHASQTEGRNREAGTSEFALFHDLLRRLDMKLCRAADDPARRSACYIGSNIA